jgi:threonyl-tRNA synthetase
MGLYSAFHYHLTKDIPMTEITFPLSTMRHSASHVLAQAVLHLYPEAKLGIGPAIDDGFYYDFELDTSLSEEDLPKIEKEMKRILKEKQKFSQYDLNREDALKKVQETNQNYKKELIEDLNLDTYSFYENGPFVDLCKGPHITHTKQIKAIKLLKVSGAYWRGSEKNKMLQRIYGTAFYTKDELNAYLERIEEAKKRDHRNIGRDLDLFSLNESIGGGLVLWHPKGAFIRNKIETLWKEKHYEEGYDLLYTPHIGKANLWETSGHLENYKENMFSPMSIDEQDYFARPMNCPFHTMVYKSKQHSYKQLPIRYAELGTVYRYERSGVLHGLFRVRGFTQDDAHIICTPEQTEDEIEKVLKFCFDVLQLFGFKKIKTYISTKPPEKAVGEDSKWDLAQSSLEKATKKMGLDYEIDEGGGAFYGPKIDIKIEDSIGRLWQCSTIQFDFNLPERFDMFFINKNGDRERPIMIHRALLGSLERFFGILIEHYAGKFPMWLAPIQAKVLTIHESGEEYATTVSKQLKAAGLRIENDFRNDKIGYKIRQGITEKVPYLIILGRQEIESNTIGVRNRETNETETMTIEKFVSSVEL